MEQFLKDIVEKAMHVKGAVTYKNLHLVRRTQGVYLAIDSDDYLICVRGRAHEIDLEHYIIKFVAVSNDVDFIDAPLQLFNGHSDVLGDEKNLFYSRIFTDNQCAVDYLELIKFIRETNPQYFINRMYK